ncbi:MAG TPA: glycosyltransferase [Pseudonocardiaceae bacterium]|nr:glycosyltransferase [Pseudonocardiaceae bacterium]
MLPLAAAARDRGHEVLWATAGDACPRVAAAGIPTASAGMPVADVLCEYHRRYPQPSTLTGEALADHMFPQLFGAIAAPAMFDAVVDLATRWQPDVVVHEAAELAAPVAAAFLGRPHVTHGFGLVSPSYRVALATAEATHLWDAVGLEPRPYGGCYDHLYIDIYPPSMQPDDLGHVGRIQHLRPASLTRVAGDELPPAVGEALDARCPVVYLTFGTIFNVNDAFRTAVAAVGRLHDIVCVVTVGPHGDLDAFGPQPSHVHIARYIPQSDLLPHCAAVVSHGGSGTLLGALAHGIPQVCLPQAADQFRNAEACDAAGAGIALVGSDVSIDRGETAVRRVLDDPHLRRNAERLAAEIADMPSVDDAVTVLEQLS